MDSLPNQEATMPAEALRIPSHVLRGALVLGPVLVLALAFQSLWTLRAATAHPDSDDMSSAADRVAQLVDAYLARIASTTSNLAIVPEVVRLAENSSSPYSAEDELVAERWQSSSGEDPFVHLRDEPVSVFFRDLTSATGGIYREIFLSDAQGRVVAASNRTEDFKQNDGDDPWWPKDLKRFTDSCRHVPMSCVQITNIEWDDSAGSLGYDVVLPVVTPGGNTVGVLKAVVDPRELDGLLNLAMLNNQFDIALINAEGMQLLSRKRFFAENQETFERLRALAPGGETSLPLAGPGQDGPVAFVRRLSSPLEGKWSIAVVDRNQGDDEAWKTYVLWCVFTIGMFVIAAGAFAARIPAPAEAPVEPRTAP
jgi:hypothetical protein